jgi:hypothetical protein
MIDASRTIRLELDNFMNSIQEGFTMQATRNFLVALAGQQLITNAEAPPVFLRCSWKHQSRAATYKLQVAVSREQQH